MPTRNVHLTEHYDKFIAAGVDSGRFSNASEIVREGLRLLEQHEAEGRAKIEWLRGAAQEGMDAIERGDYTVLDKPEQIDALMDNIHRDVMTELAAEPQSV